MNKFYYFLLIFVVSVFSANSQSFNVSEIDARDYPTVRANFSAFNSEGRYYSNISSNDFKVNENGLILAPQLVQLSCSENLPVNVVLVLDRSSSMNEKYDGETLWQWVMEGATEFIENFPFSDSAKVAIVNFAGGAKLTCDFTSNKKELLDSLKKIPDAYGSTNYNHPILDPNIGAIKLLQSRPAYHTRAIVFLTDGTHESGDRLRSEEIEAGLINNNIRFYGITLMVGISSDLQTWAKMTAGKYSFIASKAGLKSIYKTFAEDLKGTIQCQLVWQAPDICDLSELYRRVGITFNILDLTVTRDYLAPNQNRAFIDVEKPQYIFGDPPVGQSTEHEIVISPKVKGIYVNNISIMPNEYFEIIDWGDGSSTQPNFPFFVPVDFTKKIKVRFTQKNVKKIRQATLLIDATPCPLEIPLFGGYQQVNIEEPNLELFSYCDSVFIKWSGIDSKILVDLLYSTDGGVRWNIIRRNVSGNSFKWNPNFESSNLMVKVRISEQYNYDFINSHGGTGNDFSTSVTATKNGNYHLVSGYFSGTTDIGGITKTSKGKEDMFLAKFDIEGNPVWVKSGGSPGYDDRANGVALDGRGNAYLTGYTYQGTRIENYEPIFDYPDSKYLFLTKFSPSGQYNNTAYLGATFQYPDFQAEGIKIKTTAVIGQQIKIVVVGNYKGSFYEPKIKATLTLSDQFRPFTAIYDEYLNLLELYPGVKDNLGFSDVVYTDPVTLTKYETGSYIGTKNVQGKSLTSKGQSDFWVYKYAKNPISEDLSEKFEVLRPVASFSSNTYDFGPVVFGDSTIQTATAFIKNTGKLPYRITSYTIKDVANVDMTDFEVRTDILGKVILPDEGLDVELWFKPGYLNIRQAVLTVSGECALDIKIDLKGEGVCGGVSTEVHDFGDVNLNKQKFDTLFCVYRNISQTSTVIAPQVRGGNWEDFYIIIPDYHKHLVASGRITVPPGECIDLIVRFEPKSMGKRSTDINFFVQAPCKNSFTKLIGNGIASDVGVTSFDWGERRINGIYSGEIEIVNNSNGTETIDNIQFENATGTGIFEFENVQIPFDMQANSKRKLAVTFKPVQETEYAENILVFVESRQDPLLSNLTGIGILPKLTTTVSCGSPVQIGETAQASITLNNPSSSAILKVKSIKIQGNDEFKFPNGVITTDFVIDKEGSVTLPVNFTPVQGGDYSDVFIILADNYDGTFTEEWKETRVNINCDGLELDYQPVEYGNLIVCNENSLPVTITNKSKETDIVLQLSSMFLSGGTDVDYSQFELPVLDDVTLKGGTGFNFEVKFNPKSIGSFAADLNIPNSMGSPIVVKLSGSASGIELGTDKKEVNLNTADKFRMPIFAKIPFTASGKVNSLKISFDTDPVVLTVVNNSFKSNLNSNWNWSDLINEGNGKYSITGTGEINHNQIIELFSVEIMALLNDKNRAQIMAEIDYGCSQEYFELTIVNIAEVCFNDNRMIQVKSDAKFGISVPNPNPADQFISFNYGVGFDTFTRIEITNYFGETIKLVYEGNHKAGEYQANIPTLELSSGSYIIRMISGPFSESRQLMIVK